MKAGRWGWREVGRRGGKWAGSGGSRRAKASEMGTTSLEHREPAVPEKKNNCI